MADMTWSPVRKRHFEGRRLGESLKKKPKFAVTCGNKEGILHKDRFNKSAPCILSHEQWFTPPEFEKFGGKEKSKKWKSSILHNQIQLQTFIQGGFLSSPSFRTKRSQVREQRMKKLIRSRRSTRHSKNSPMSKSVSTSDWSSGSDRSNDDDDYVRVTERAFSDDDDVRVTEGAFSDDDDDADDVRVTERAFSDDDDVRVTEGAFSDDDDDDADDVQVTERAFSGNNYDVRVTEGAFSDDDDDADDVQVTERAFSGNNDDVRVTEGAFSDDDDAIRITEGAFSDDDDDVRTTEGAFSDDDDDDDVRITEGAFSDDDDDDGDDVQVTEGAFSGESFNVTCSTGTGALHVNRFATETCGKCIRTQDAWLTPKEFLNQNKTDGNWRRDIIGHGVPLGMLIMRRVLKLHTVNCKCPICTKEPLHLLDQFNDDVCFKCSRDGDLVCCDNCPRAFHHQCHKPALRDDTIGEHWTCSFCTNKSS